MVTLPGAAPSSADPVVAASGALPRPASELEPPVRWRMRSRPLSCPALVGRQVLFQWADEGPGWVCGRVVRVTSAGPRAVRVSTDRATVTGPSPEQATGV